MRMKASAYKQYGDAAILSLVLEALPQVSIQLCFHYTNIFCLRRNWYSCIQWVGGGGRGRWEKDWSKSKRIVSAVSRPLPTVGISDIPLTPALFNSRLLPRCRLHSPRRTRSWWSAGRTGPRRRSASSAGPCRLPSPPSLGWTSQGWVRPVLPVLPVLQWPPSHDQWGRSANLSMWVLSISTDHLGGNRRWSPGFSCPPCPLCCINIIRTSKSFPVSSSLVYWCSVCDWGILQSSAREQNWTLGLARGWEVITTDWFWHIVRPGPALSSCPAVLLLPCYPQLADSRIFRWLGSYLEPQSRTRGEVNSWKLTPHSRSENNSVKICIFKVL